MGHVGQAFGIRLGISRFWSYKKISRAFFIDEYLFNLFHLFIKKLFKHRHWTHFGVIFNKAFCFVEDKKITISVFLYDLAIERASKRIYLRQRRNKKNFSRASLHYRHKLKHTRFLARKKKISSRKFLDYKNKLNYSLLYNYLNFGRKFNKWKDSTFVYSLFLGKHSSLDVMLQKRPWLKKNYDVNFFKKCRFKKIAFKRFLSKLKNRLVSNKYYPKGHRYRVNAFLNGTIDENQLFEMPTFDIRPESHRTFFLRGKLKKKAFPRLKHYQIRRLRGFRYIQRILFQTFRVPAYKYLWKLFIKLIFSNRLARHNIESYFQIRIINMPAYRMTAYALAAFALRRLRYEDKVGSIFRPILRKLRKMVQGVRILCCGRFTRRQRASRILFSHGKISQSKLSVPVDFQFVSTPLKYGVGSVKIWLVKK